MMGWGWAGGWVGVILECGAGGGVGGGCTAHMCLPSGMEGGAWEVGWGCGGRPASAAPDAAARLTHPLPLCPPPRHIRRGLKQGVGGGGVVTPGGCAGRDPGVPSGGGCCGGGTDGREGGREGKGRVTERTGGQTDGGGAATCGHESLVMQVRPRSTPPHPPAPHSPPVGHRTCCCIRTASADSHRIHSSAALHLQIRRDQRAKLVVFAETPTFYSPFWIHTWWPHIMAGTTLCHWLSFMTGNATQLTNTNM